MKSMHMLTAERRQKQQIETVQDSASSLWVSCDCPHTHPDWAEHPLQPTPALLVQLHVGARPVAVKGHTLEGAGRWNHLRPGTAFVQGEGVHWWCSQRQRIGSGPELWLVLELPEPAPTSMSNTHCGCSCSSNASLLPVLGGRLAHTEREWSQLGPCLQCPCFSSLGPDPTPNRRCWPLSREDSSHLALATALPSPVLFPTKAIATSPPCRRQDSCSY